MLTLEPHTPPNSVRFRVCKEHVHQPFLGYKPPGSDPNRGYQWVTYGEFGTMVDSARALLHRSGIGKGDTVRTHSVHRGSSVALASEKPDPEPHLGDGDAVNGPIDFTDSWIDWKPIMTPGRWPLSAATAWSGPSAAWPP